MKVSAKKSLGKRALALVLALLLAVTSLSVAMALPAGTGAEAQGGTQTLASDLDDELAALYAQIEAYEEKMDGNTVYTNMDAAYTAYCAACKAYYENYYGYEYDDGSKAHQQNVEEVTSATDALQTALTNMETFTGYVGEATTAADGSYTTGTLTSKSAGATYPVATLGEGHNDTALYDELSGVMYTYGIGSSAGYVGPGASVHSITSVRLDGAGVNAGLVYGSIVFLYTGTNHDSQYNQTSTYAVPIGSYSDGNTDYARRNVLYEMGVSLTEEEKAASYTLNGNAFEIRRDWHGYQTDTFGYTPTTNGTIYPGGNTSYSENTYYYGYDTTQGYGGTNCNSSYITHVFGASSGNHTSVYSNTLYFTGDMNTTAPSSLTTNNSYYSKFDMLDYQYFRCGNNVGGNGGKYYFIRPSRANMNLIGFDSSSALTAASNFSSGNLSSNWSNNSITSDAQPGGAADSYIYVVDYDSVLTALDNNKKYLNMVDDNYYYRYGSSGMHAILAAYDQLTEYDPNSSFLSNGTNLDVDNLVGMVAGVLSSYVSDLESAVSLNVSNSRVTGYDTVTTFVHHMILTGYDENGNSEKYNFLRNGVYATSGTDAIGDYTWHNDGDTITAAGTVGVATRTLNPPSTLVQTTNQVAGYEYNQAVTDKYYSASDEGFIHAVNITRDGGGQWGTQMYVTVYSATAELYVYHTPEEIELTVNYVDKSNATLKTSTVTLEYYKTALEAESFVQGGSKWVRTSTEISSTYPSSYFEADANGTTHSYTWNSSAVSDTANYITTVEYEAQAVNVVYAAYSVILQNESTNEFIGGSTQQDGYVQLNGSSEVLAQVSESPTAAYTTAESVSANGTVAPVGATAVKNDSLSNDKFLYWFVSTKSPEEISYTDFTAANYISAVNNLVPNLETDAAKIGLESIADWDENTTYYYYAVFTADEMNTETKHITVVLNVTDEENWESLIGSEFIIHVEDTLTGGDAVYSADTVAVIGNDGTATVVFDVLPGECTVKVISDFAYGFSDASDNETVDPSSEDDHTVTFKLSYNPLNTADNDSDIQTNIFVLGSDDTDS